MFDWFLNWAQLVHESGFPSLFADKVYQQPRIENRAAKTVTNGEKGKIKLSIGYLLVSYYTISIPYREKHFVTLKFYTA